MSLGFVAAPAHSLGWFAQNSTHPSGGCVALDPRETVIRFGSATVGSGPIMLAASAAIKTVPDFIPKIFEIAVATIIRPRRPLARHTRHWRASW